MKYITLLSVLAFYATLTVLLSCSSKGETTQPLIGTEAGLPPELKGLKVYSVAISQGTSIYVAVLDGKINSVSEKGEDEDKTTIMVNVAKSKIVYETDSVILLKK